MGCVCVPEQHDETGRKERAISYLSQKFTDYETRYSPLEKTCLALVWATQRLRHYMLAYPVKLLARMDLLKYLFEKPALTGRTARWQFIFSKLDITYVTQKSIKGQAVADHLASHPLPDYEPLRTDFPDEEILFATEEEAPMSDEWTIYLDGAMNEDGSGVGLVQLSPEMTRIPFIGLQVEFPMYVRTMLLNTKLALLASSPARSYRESVCKSFIIPSW